jgi:hypothetical protein
MSMVHACAGLSVSFLAGAPAWVLAAFALLWLAAVAWLARLQRSRAPAGRFTMPGSPLSPAAAMLANLHLICERASQIPDLVPFLHLVVSSLLCEHLHLGKRGVSWVLLPLRSIKDCVWGGACAGSMSWQAYLRFALWLLLSLAVYCLHSVHAAAGKELYLPVQDAQGRCIFRHCLLASL